MVLATELISQLLPDPQATNLSVWIGVHHYAITTRDFKIGTPYLLYAAADQPVFG
jgi:hypothetical protein